MRVYTRVVIDMDSLAVEEADSFEYEGPVALCGAGNAGHPGGGPPKPPQAQAQNSAGSSGSSGSARGGASVYKASWMRPSPGLTKTMPGSWGAPTLLASGSSMLGGTDPQKRTLLG